MSQQRLQYQPWNYGAMCNECPLFHAGKTPIAPTGPWSADMVFVGEAPAKWEEVKGQVLQGPSGQKLNEMLWKIGRRRESVYCTNAIACRVETPGEQGSRRWDMKVYMAWHRKQNKIRKEQGQVEVKSPFECCIGRLKTELDTLQRAAELRGEGNLVVVPLGNYANTQIKAIYGERIEGKMGSIMKMRGSVIEVKP